ncbi:hypothetical protein FKM82_004767 [Ascaphus truei]
MAASALLLPGISSHGAGRGCLACGGEEGGGLCPVSPHEGRYVDEGDGGEGGLCPSARYLLTRGGKIIIIVMMYSGDCTRDSRF